MKAVDQLVVIKTKNSLIIPCDNAFYVLFIRSLFNITTLLQLFGSHHDSDSQTKLSHRKPVENRRKHGRKLGYAYES